MVAVIAVIAIIRMGVKLVVGCWRVCPAALQCELRIIRNYSELRLSLETSGTGTKLHCAHVHYDSH
jgi:hypothetical protein